jgi:preprotein translocase subunit YajC
MAELVPLLFIAIAVVFLLVLPMRQRNRAMQQAKLLQDSLAIGTEVMTTSGLYGTVVGLGDDAIDLEISPGVTVHWAKAAVAEVKSAVVPEPEAARADSEPDSV